MNEALKNILERNSHRNLVEPIPSKDEMEKVFQAALRAPDHAWLRPSSFIQISGEGLQKLSNIFVDFAKENFDDLTAAEKFSFENYVEFRIRFFSFGFNIVDKKLVGAQNSRIKYFFADAGVRSCYEKMNKEGRIPPLWSEVIERAI